MTDPDAITALIDAAETGFDAPCAELAAPAREALARLIEAQNSCHSLHTKFAEHDICTYIAKSESPQACAEVHVELVRKIQDASGGGWSAFCALRDENARLRDLLHRCVLELLFYQKDEELLDAINAELAAAQPYLLKKDL